MQQASGLHASPSPSAVLHAESQNNTMLLGSDIQNLLQLEPLQKNTIEGRTISKGQSLPRRHPGFLKVVVYLELNNAQGTMPEQLGLALVRPHGICKQLNMALRWFEHGLELRS